jgi:hypothetical protein
MAYIDALSEIGEIGEGQKPWCDLVFDVVDTELYELPLDWEDREVIIQFERGVAKADLKGETIGFAFYIPRNGWSPSENQTPDLPTLLGSSIILESIGTETDRLVACYADWFGHPTSQAPATAQLLCGAVCLDVGPPLLDSEKCHFKLFLEPPSYEEAEAEESNDDELQADEGSEDYPYAELFLNVDLPSKRAWLREKDPEFRLQILEFMTGKFETESSIPLWTEASESLWADE